MKLLHVELIVSLFLTTLLYAGNEKVTLLLKWQHQFQFAGYYMAKEKGYYDELGLDVTFEEYLENDIAKKLETEDSTYATLDPFGIIEQLNGAKIRPIAAIFQQSPLIFLSLKTANIKTPFDLENKRIMANLNVEDAPLTYLLKKENILPTSYQLIKSDFPNIEDLISKKADVIAAYLTDAPYQLNSLGFDYNIIDPMAYGVDFYGDMLFASENEYEKHPSRVKRFLSASIKGWQYALEHIDESIDVIKKHYNKTQSKEVLFNEAKRIKEIMMAERIPVGTLSQTKINNMISSFNSLGFISNQVKGMTLEREFYTNDTLSFWKQLSSEEKSYLASSPQINFGVRDNFPPFSFQQKDKEFQGLSIDIIKRLEKLIGLSVQIVPYKLSEEENLINNKSIDIFFKDPAYMKDKKFLYTQKLYGYSAGVFSKNKLVQIDAIQDLNTKKIGVLKGGVAQGILKSHKEIELILKDSVTELVNALLKDDVDFIIDAFPTIDFYVKNFYISDIYPNGVFYNYPYSNHLIISQDLGILAGILQKAVIYITQKSNQDFQNLLSLWLYSPEQKNRISLSKEELSWISSHKTIKIANDVAYPPFDFFEDGMAKGFSVELIAILAEKLGLEVSMVTDSWDILIDKFRQKEIDVLTTVSPTKDLDLFSLYTKPYSDMMEVVVTHIDNNNIQYLSDIKGKNLSLPDNFGIIEELKNIQVDANIVKARDSLESLLDVTLYKADATIMTLTVFEYLKEKYHLSKLKIVDFLNYSNAIQTKAYFAVHNSNPMLQSLLNKALDSLSVEELRDIKEKWFAYSLDIKNPRIVLSSDEATFLRNHPVVRVGSDSTWPPFDFVKGDKVQGYARDFYTLLEKRLGIRFRFEQSLTWSKTIEDFKNNRYDMLSLLAKNKERENYVSFSPPILSSYTALALRDETPMIKSVQELVDKKLSLGMTNDFWFVSTLKSNYPKMLLKTYDSPQEAFVGLKNGSIDAYIDTVASLSYTINRNLLSNLKISPAISIGGNIYETFHIGIRKDWDIFQSLIKRAIDSIPEAEILTLQRKWFGNVLEGHVSKQLLLSDFEKKFIQTNPSIRIGIDTVLTPFDFVDIDNKHAGIVHEMTQYFFEESLGISLIEKREPAWNMHLKSIQTKDLDVIAGIAKTPEREKLMLFSDPYVKLPLVLVGSVDSEFIDSLEFLQNKKVGAIESSFSYEIIKSKYPNLKPIAYKTLQDALVAASNKEIDYVFDSLPTINYALKQEGITNLKLLGKTNEMIELSYGVREDWPELVMALNKMIRTIPKDKYDSILNRWVQFSVEKKIDYALIWKIVIAFMLVISFIVYWNRKLSNEISRRKIIEKALYEAQVKAENANKAKSEFLSNMSHEIRTPMNAVVGFAELTAKMDLPQKALKNISIIQKSAKALIAIINDILDLSKIEAGKINIELRPTNIKNLAEDLYAIFSLRAENKNIFFDIACGQYIQNSLFIDELRVRQVLINLIGNAIKFTNKGSVKVNFQLSSEEDETKVTLHVSIQDTGIGIKNEDKSKVFEMFEQQSAQDNRAYGGTGLGLSISLKLAQLMGGNIVLESEEKKGSTFTLIIPDLKLTSIISQVVHEENKSNTLFEKSTILIVDDIEENLELLQDILELHNFDVIQTTSGEESILLAEEKMPNLILMDIKMPHVDGYEASNAIRTNSITAHIPIIAVTASVFGEREKILEKGCFDDIVPKPINIIELEKAMAKFLPTSKQENTLPIQKDFVATIQELQIMTEDKLAVLELAQKVLLTGDLSVVDDILVILEKEKANQHTIVKIKNALENRDVDIVELEISQLISFLTRKG